MGEHTQGKPFWQDAAERVGWTFVEAAAGTFAASTWVFDLSLGQAAINAGLIAAAGAVKVIAARFIGKPDAAIG